MSGKSDRLANVARMLFLQVALRCRIRQRLSLDHWGPDARHNIVYFDEFRPTNNAASDASDTLLHTAIDLADGVATEYPPSVKGRCAIEQGVMIFPIDNIRLIGVLALHIRSRVPAQTDGLKM